MDDPLQDAMYETWGADLDDWEMRECSDDELIGVLYSDESSAESVAQNVLSIALALLLCLAVGNVVWRIVVVSWALLSAAVRYTTVALILLSIAVFLA
ncbi:g9587 [Coccomyxa elongata]